MNTTIHAITEFKRKYLPLTHEAERVAKMSLLEFERWLAHNTPEHIQQVLTHKEAGQWRRHLKPRIVSDVHLQWEVSKMRRNSMNEKIKPMLAEGSPQPFNDPSYIWEIKYDGARILSFINGSNVHLQARSGSDKTDTFPELRIETRRPAILDGEVVSATGLSFQDSIQKRINRTYDVLATAVQCPAKLVVFDCLEIDGKSVEHLPLETRKGLLAEVLIPTENTELAPFYEDGITLWTTVIENDLEGLVGKLKASQYLRNKRKWLKVKAWKRNYGKNSTGETILAIGYTQGTGWRESTFGALVLARLGVDGVLTYVGEVGTGFDQDEIKALYAMSSSGVCPWTREPGPATWIKPFVIKVQYLEYTNEGIMRFPSFKGVV